MASASVESGRITGPPVRGPEVSHSAGGAVQAPPDVFGYLLRTSLLRAVNPFTVGLTQGIGARAVESCVQRGAAALLVATAVARKNVPTANRTENRPLAVTRTRLRVVSLFLAEPPRIVTLAPPRACPAW